MDAIMKTEQSQEQNEEDSSEEEFLPDVQVLKDFRRKQRQDRKFATPRMAVEMKLANPLNLDSAWDQIINVDHELKDQFKDEQFERRQELMHRYNEKQKKKLKKTFKRTVI